MASNVRGSNVFRYGNEGPVGVVWTVREEGADVSTTVTELDFVGEGINASGGGAAVDIAVPAFEGLTVQEEGVDQSTGVEKLDFVGGGGVLSGTEDVTSISVSDLDVTVQRDGVDVNTGSKVLNFTGNAVSAAGGGSTTSVAISPVIDINFDNGVNSIDYPVAGNTVFHGTNTYYAITGSKRETSICIGNLSGNRPVTRQTAVGYACGAGGNTFSTQVGRSSNAGLEDVVVGNYSGSSGAVIGRSSNGSGVTVGNYSNPSSGVSIGHGCSGSSHTVSIGMDALSQTSYAISLGKNAVARTWVLNTAGEFAIESDSAMLGGSTPAIPANATNLWRVRLNGVNYTIPLMVDQ